MIASPFSRQPFTEKLQLIKNGRPTPELESKEKVRTMERHFKTENSNFVKKKIFYFIVTLMII